MENKNSILEEIERIENIPGFVYVIRKKDLFKIGITISLKRRIKELKPDEIVAVKEAANIRGIEKRLHKRYKHRRVPQSEYFWLNKEEVNEVIYLLGGEAAKGYQIADSIKEEVKLLEKTAKNKNKLTITPSIQKIINELQSNFDTLGAEKFLWEEIYDSSTGEKELKINLIRNLKNDSPSIKIPLSDELLKACETFTIKEDVFMPIAKSEDEQEAQINANRIYLDFLLIHCWYYWNGFLLIEKDQISTYKNLIKSMERALRANGIWYTNISQWKRGELEVLMGWSQIANPINSFNDKLSSYNKRQAKERKKRKQNKENKAFSILRRFIGRLLMIMTSIGLMAFGFQVLICGKILWNMFLAFYSIHLISLGLADKKQNEWALYPFVFFPSEKINRYIYFILITLFALCILILSFDASNYCSSLTS